jgi:N4-gp56 family major capsid protein
MADAHTQQSSVSSDTTAFNRMAYFALRNETYFDQACDVRPTNQTHPGAAVTFFIYADLAEATTALTETADVDAVALSDSTVTVTLVEYGNAVLTTAKLRRTSLLDVDMDAANIVGYNAGVSIDSVARDVFAGGTNVVYGTGGTSDPTSRATVQAEDTITAYDIRKVTAQLRGAAVATRDGGLYVGYIHPSVSMDLRSETGAAAWRDPHVYVDTANIYRGEIGAFEGVRFIEAARAKKWTGSGSAGIDVYATIICGAQAVAKAHATGEGYGAEPKIVHGPVTDKLERFRPVGWTHLVGYSRFREASLRRIESSASLG